MILEKDELYARLQKIKILISDIDGVMTDGGILLGTREEMKKFNTADGAGIKFLLRNDVMVALITGRESSVVDRRARELGIQEVHQRALKKLPVFEQVLNKYSIQPEEAAYIGDDLPDIPLLKRVGVAITVADAVKEVKDIAHFITGAKGGDGAVREVAELILKAQDKWSQVVNWYLEQ